MKRLPFSHYHPSGTSLCLLILAAALCLAGGVHAAHRRVDTGAAPAQADPRRDLLLELSITRGETSKDSHSTIHQCRIVDGHAVYSGPCGTCEQGECPHRRIEFDLTMAQAAALVAVIRSNGLFRNFKEIGNSMGTGTWVRARLSLRTGGLAGAITIDGMLHRWSPGRNGPGEISISAKDTLEDLERLRRAITDIAKTHFPGYH